MGIRIDAGTGSDSSQPIVGIQPYTGVAYHYTNAEGALGILTTRVLWATAASMLNDSSELSYGAERVRAVYETWEPPEDHDLGGVVALRKAISDLDSDLALDRTFIVSASTNQQSLNQWAHYANGSGYVLGFRANEALVQERVSSTAKPLEEDRDGVRIVGTLGVWRRVTYDPGEQEAVVRSVLDHIARLSVKDGRAPRILAIAISLMKHPSFAVEEEARMVLWQDDNTRVKFRTRGAHIVPFVQLTSIEDCPEEGSNTWHPSFFLGGSGELSDATDLPLTSAYTGPPIGEDAARRTATLEALVRALGYDASVGHIPIPLR